MSDTTPSVSVKKSDEEKATISISLPTSILKDQKHFQSVIETINNTLLTKNTETTETETEKEEPSPSTVWLLQGASHSFVFLLNKRGDISTFYSTVQGFNKNII